VEGGTLTGNFDWEKIYEKESPVLYGYLVKKAGAQAAEDILQECFLRVLDMTEKKGAPQNIRAYLFQIARNLMIENEALVEKQSDLGVETNAFFHRINGESELVKKEITEILNQSFHLLDDQEAEVFYFRWDQGLSSKEIACIIKTSDRHVRRILKKGARKIESFFKNKGWGSEYVLSQ